MRAAQAGKKILLANKEALVIAGNVFMQAAREGGACILPVDSEHNAIFQALPPDISSEGSSRWGGPDHSHRIRRAVSRCARDSGLRDITPSQACKHPNWVMGRKISVDSATLMNKGLELIEARWLFNATPGATPGVDPSAKHRAFHGGLP